MVIRFSKAEMSKAAKALRNAHKRGELPAAITMMDMNGKKQKVDKKHYMSLFEAQNLFIRNKGRYPNWVTLNGTATNPVVLYNQPDSITCGVYSFQMCTQYLFDWIKPSIIKKAFKTVEKGQTTPANLIAGAKSLGYKVTKIPRTYEAVKKCLDNNIPVIGHIQTAGSTKPYCLQYDYNYGHYLHINKAKDNKFTVLDPSRSSVKTCRASEIVQATNGRAIYFYKVEVL